MKHDMKPVKPKLISFATELFLCKKLIFLSLGNKLVKRINESLKFLFVFWRKSLFLKISKLLQQHFLLTWTRLFSNHDSNCIGICRMLRWIKRVALFQYLQKDLKLYQNLILTTLDHPANAYFLFQSVMCSAILIWNHLQNKYSNHDFMKLAPKSLKNFLLTQKLIFLYCD